MTNELSSSLDGVKLSYSSEVGVAPIQALLAYSIFDRIMAL